MTPFSNVDESVKFVNEQEYENKYTYRPSQLHSNW